VVMRSSLAVLLLVLLCSGCTLFQQGQTDGISEQERQFAGALQFLRQGNEQRARALLEQVVLGPRHAGISDEALFRLALLKLRDDEKGPQEAHTLLMQLSTQHPDGIWARQAAPLVSFLATTQKLLARQRDTRGLRELNSQLYRENKELRLNIEKLKKLDLELDRKSIR